MLQSITPLIYYSTSFIVSCINIALSLMLKYLKELQLDNKLFVNMLRFKDKFNIKAYILKELHHGFGKQLKFKGFAIISNSLVSQLLASFQQNLSLFQLPQLAFSKPIFILAVLAQIASCTYQQLKQLVNSQSRASL